MHFATAKMKLKAMYACVNRRPATGTKAWNSLFYPALAVSFGWPQFKWPSFRRVAFPVCAFRSSSGSCEIDNSPCFVRYRLLCESPMDSYTLFVQVLFKSFFSIKYSMRADLNVCFRGSQKLWIVLCFAEAPYEPSEKKNYPASGKKSLKSNKRSGFRYCVANIMLGR